MKRNLLLAAVLLVLAPLSPTGGQEARARWETMNQIRRDKFALVLPEVMRENGIDMWITVMREGLHDPLYEDLGRGYVGGVGYYIFTDRGGDRIERAVLGVGTALVEDNGAYDIFGSPEEPAISKERSRNWVSDRRSG